MPSPSTLFSAYASMAASMMLFRSMINELLPHPIRSSLLSSIHYLFKTNTPTLTLVIEEFTGMTQNQIYDAAATYLCTKISPKTERLKISKIPKEKNLTIHLEKGEKLVDYYEGIELHWRFVSTQEEKINPRDTISPRQEEQHYYFELIFHKKHQDIVLVSYLPFILEKAKAMKDEQRALKMHTLSNSRYVCDGVKWDSVNFEHPATFETLAMELEVKEAVMEDLNRFLKRREFYKRVGRAWKRGYLLYGPPGTGKSSLVAAMANYLKFDVYDLQLTNIVHDSELRRLLLSTANRSILVIEDIDCSVEIPDRRYGDPWSKKNKDQQDNNTSRAFVS